MTGMKMWLSSMVEIATDSTMTMPAAAESPPRKASMATPELPLANGTLMTKKSAPMVLPVVRIPLSAMGMTNRLIRNR